MYKLFLIGALYFLVSFLLASKIIVQAQTSTPTVTPTPTLRTTGATDPTGATGTTGVKSGNDTLPVGAPKTGFGI